MKSPLKIISFLFGVLFFLVPLILWPYSSELFELNKIVVTYILTILIVAVWIIRMVIEKKFIFRRTILDIPLMVFLGSQVISTLVSIDPSTSLIGYYSRFNGGLLSIISYLLLYWAFVSNIGKKSALKLINITLISAAIVSIYGVLERLGIDKNIWQQDVQHRVFSTLGQPNWLAAWLTALMPITWVLIIKQRNNKFGFKLIIPYILMSLFFTTLIFTGSRSGLIGLLTSELIFWAFVFIKYKFSFLKEFILTNALIVLMAALLGTQYTPSIFKLIKRTEISPSAKTIQPGGTSLEFGGTESGTIRKIVWRGAFETWKHYPIFGTGVETFAYSYYLYRPVEHNLTSEWDFIYNKAHNEYLNFMANSGTVGTIAYLVMLGFFLYFIFKNAATEAQDKQNGSFPMSVAFLAGLISISITNFFGFSVVPIQLLFYLFPALSLALVSSRSSEDKNLVNLDSGQKFASWLVASVGLFLIYAVCRFWYADTLYASGSGYNKISRQDLASSYLSRAVKLEPNQALYYSELARSYTNLALAYNEAKQATLASQLTKAAIANSIKAVELSPANVNMKRVQFGVLIMLSSIKPEYLLSARDVLISSIAQAPTDAKIYYNLGLVYSRTGQNDLALETLKKTIDLKPNYKDARLAYAILLSDAGRKDEARYQLEYILSKIDPTDSLSKQQLESIK